MRKLFNAECSKELCYLSAAMLGVANAVVSLFGRGSVTSTRNPTLYMLMWASPKRSKDKKDVNRRGGQPAQSFESKALKPNK